MKKLSVFVDELCEDSHKMNLEISVNMKSMHHTILLL